MPSSGVQTCALDRKSTRLNSSNTIISYAVFCLKKTLDTIQRASSVLERPRTRRALAREPRGGARHRGAAPDGGSVFIVAVRVRLFFLRLPGPPEPAPLPPEALPP